MSTKNTHQLPYGDILVVDDNISNLKFLMEILTKAGYDVRPASDGELALRSVKAKIPELILLDYKMPGIDGIEVCRRLKGDPETEGIPVIFLSALRETELKVKALEAGGIDYVTKPIQPAEVLARINTHLNMYRLQRRLEARTNELIVEIEARKKAEKINERSQFLLKAALESTADGILVVARDNSWSNFNQKYIDMWKITASIRESGDDQAALEYVSNFLVNPEEFIDRTRELYDNPEEDSFDLLELKDGRFIERYSHPKRLHGKIVGRVWSFRDITKRKKAEELLRESEGRLLAIFQAAENVAFIMTDLGGKETRILDFSPGAEKIFGYTRQEAIDQFVSILHTPESVEQFTEMQTRLREGYKGYSGETILFRKTGEQFPALFTLHPLFDSNGILKGTVGVSLDITERKQAEEEVKHQLLEKEIMLKEVHHRIKNNFASVESLLTLHAESISNPEALSVLQDAIGRVNSMQVLYKKLLLTDNYQVTSVKEYLNNLIDEIINIFPENIDLTVKKQIYDFKLAPKRLVPIGIILNEVLTNTMKYAFTGRDSGLIQITLENNQGNMILTIQDNGNGLPEGFDISKSEGFGFMLVTMLTQQLEGIFTISNKNGTRSTLEFEI